MSTVRDDIKKVFEKGNSSGVQLILVNGFVFLGLLIVKMILSMSPETESLSLLLDQNLQLSANLSDLVLKPWTLITYGFINESFLSFLFNSLALYWFGILMHDFLGNRKLVNIYFIGYTFAGVLYVLVFGLISLSKSTLHLSHLVAGTTAAVYAVMFATVTLIPNYEFYLFRKFYLKIKYLAVVFLVFSFFEPSGGLLNLGGAFIGYVYIKLMQIGIDLGSPIEAVQEWLSGLIRTKPKRIKPKFKAKQFTHSTVGATTMKVHVEEEPEYHSDQEEIDILLDKISISGYESLSQDEKERLFRASQSDEI